MRKRTIVDWCLSALDGWNTALHESIEHRVMANHHKTFPNGGADELIERSREFYYGRMTTTANLIVAIIAMALGLVALIVSAVALALS